MKKQNARSALKKFYKHLNLLLLMKKRAQFSIENFPRFPHGIRKRGQFFILAAVILAGIIISLGLTTNEVRVNREPENFYDFSYEVSKEAGVVLDHEIYYGFDDDVNLEDFVDLLAQDIRDKDPDANLIFIYGNTAEMILRNYGAETVGAEGEDVTGGGGYIINTISFCSGNSCSSTDTSQLAETHGDEWTQPINLGEDADSMNIEIRGQDYNFPISEHKQVIFIMQKDVEDETFIAVE